MASICGRENAVAMMKNLVQYTRGFTKRTLISEALTSLATLAISTATTTKNRKEKYHCQSEVHSTNKQIVVKDCMYTAEACVYALLQYSTL